MYTKMKLEDKLILSLCPCTQLAPKPRVQAIIDVSKNCRYFNLTLNLFDFHDYFFIFQQNFSIIQLHQSVCLLIFYVSFPFIYLQPFSIHNFLKISLFLAPLLNLQARRCKNMTENWKKIIYQPFSFSYTQDNKIK